MNLLVLEMLLKDIKEIDIEVRTAMNGQKAVEVVQNTRGGEVFSHVILDLHMPVMDGYQAAKALRDMMAAGNRQLQGAKIYALSATNEDIFI